MVQLLKHKCLPIQLYALEVCNLDKRILQSLDFTVNRFFTKLFRTSNIHCVSKKNIPDVLSYNSRKH